jgi:two-component system alkaline phosphatase synthesis response regulator PhoP
MTIEQEAKIYYIKNLEGKDITQKDIINVFIEGYNRRNNEINVQTSKLTIEDGDVAVDLERFTVINKGIEMKLPRKITMLLYYLMVNKHRVVNRKELLSKVWGDDVIVGDRTVDVHVRRIKIALNNECIRGVKGIGYKWN